MPPPQSAITERKRRGDYPTPQWLVDLIVERATEHVRAGRDVSVLDPACGDGRFLVAAARRIRQLGGRPVLVGADIHADAVAAARSAMVDADATIMCGDALEIDWGDRCFDVVLGNPPYLSQLAAGTTRGGASRHGGGPYADAAVEFLALAVRLTRPGGRVGVVLPQSVLASRDAATVRASVERTASITWSWWSPRPVFDAQVLVCALVLERHTNPLDEGARRPWSEVVTGRLGIPRLPQLRTSGTLGQRSLLTANFRDQYYGLVPAVVEDGDGPALVTSRLVDPGRCRWGERPVTFAKRRFLRPTVELDRLTAPMRRWADSLLVPKVLIANQTRVVEAVADAAGTLIPGIPLISARPTGIVDAPAIAAVLTSPVASAWAWHRAGGTGLSGGAVRLGPRWMADLPWPAGDVTAASAALEAGDVGACGAAITSAYGLDPDDPHVAALADWWQRWLPVTAAPGGSAARLG